MELAASRRMFLSSAAAATLAGAAARKPNIVWMMADDLGLGDLGCYGQKYIRTPHIDKLASEGVRCNSAYAGCSVCAPARSVLMTGLHAGHTPIRSNPGGVPLLPEERTVADLLHEGGYRTGLFGKWGLGDIGSTGVPWKHGFDEFFGFLHQAHAHFQYPRFLYDNDKEFPLAGNDKPGRQTYANDVMTDRAVDFVRRRKSDPFFLYVSWTVPHFEPHVPEESMSAYRGKIPNGPPLAPANGRLKPQSEVGPAYAGMVSRLDGYVGKLTSVLRELDLDRDTLVFFTSDNGGIMTDFEGDFLNNMSGLRGRKGTMYEGGLRVPMIARWPGRFLPGSTTNYSWSFEDFLPTACSAAGLKTPKGLDGVSVLPALSRQKQKPKDHLYWELPRYNGATKTFRDEVPIQAMRRGDWKAVRSKPDGPIELYRLDQDPAESKDLAADNPKLTAEFERRIRAARVAPRPQQELPHGWWEARS